MQRTRLSARFLVLVLLAIFAGCAGAPPQRGLDKACADGLAQAYKELDFAKANGLSGTVEYTKAVSLLTAAKIQQQFEKYPNCINKVKRARYYIAQSRKKAPH